ncbi:N-acetyltransferase [Oxalobacteraceae bacterium CAVE-383]|nr:N-acetyltransferase [Oxalobacteraceae bacterium CAVE-383]
MASTSLRISSNKKELEIEVIYNFLHEHAAWAKGISREIVKQAIDGSLCFGAYLENRQVGFARLVTDMATFGYLCDVFVLPEFRCKGYASALMKHIFSLESVKGMRRIVLVTSDAHHVYRPLGFENLSHPDKYMELHRPHIFKK